MALRERTVPVPCSCCAGGGSFAACETRPRHQILPGSLLVSPFKDKAKSTSLHSTTLRPFSSSDKSKVVAADAARVAESRPVTPEEHATQKAERSRATLRGSGPQMTLPTLLTLVRVFIVPAFVPAFYLSPPAATTMFVVAAVTDWLDGYLARKMKTHTEFGAFLDPVADKLMVATVLVLLCTEQSPMPGVPSWVVAAPSIAIISREIAMSAVREWTASQGPALREVVAVSGLGKWKTATQLVSLGLLLGARMHSVAFMMPALVIPGLSFLYIASILGLVSFGQYLRSIWRFFR